MVVHENEAASHSKRPAVGAAIAALLGGWLLPQPKWPFGASADGFDWAHASSQPCTMTQPIKLSEAERLSGLLSPTHLREALATFAACGVVAIDEAIPARDVDAFRSALAARLEPHSVVTHWLGTHRAHVLLRSMITPIITQSCVTKEVKAYPASPGRCH